ncbi:MAG TPA: hypothetical protein VMT16_12985 [Thermoanaerobaculia bacterium]|nr:hypothetical protein [Thermoanaerobaculia bacterium]
MREHDVEDAAEERLLRELRRLAAGPAPPPGLEERVVAQLRGQGLLAHAWRRRLLAAAAAAILFAAGLLAGRSWVAPAATAPPASHYALFLLGGVDPGPDEEALVEEYRAWAVGLARTGQLAAGEKLGPSAWLLSAGADTVSLQTAPAAHRAAPLSGFFLLTTRDPAAALEIARSCPHLRHGGEVLLRPIEPT